MRVETPQLLWHSEEDKNVNAAINGVSLLQSGIVDPTKDVYGNVLATGGNSNILNLWKIVFPPATSGNTIFQKHSDNQNKIEHLCSLTRPDSAVHTVAFSPDGLHLGAGLSTGSVLIWSVPHNKRGNGNGKHFWSGVTREQDLMIRIVQLATDNISDLCWSADSQRLVVGSVDGAMSICELKEDNWRSVYKNGMDHSHYIQGVCYDPTGVYIASMSSDRSVRVVSRKTPKKKKKKTTEVMGKLEMNLRSKEIRRSRNGSGVNKYYFCDEATLNSFVRRLAWTPDGAFLITPAALHGSSGYATLMFARHHFDEPYRILGGLEKPSLAVRPNPVLFELPEPGSAKVHDSDVKENQSPVSSSRMSLPYRSIFAVLTWDTVLIYDSHHRQPLSIIRGLHYAHLMDATWSADGHALVVCSNDGYLSIINFAEGELGKVYQQPVEIAQPATAPASTASLPPCEPGPVAVLQTRPAKKVKLMVPMKDEELVEMSDPPSAVSKRSADEAMAGVDKLTLTDADAQKKKKKRIQPILLQSA